MWGQSNKFPLSYSSLKCLLQVKKMVRENSAKRIVLQAKQTLSQSALGKFTSINLLSKKTLLFCIVLIVERWYFCSLVQVLVVGLAKWRKKRIWTLENKLKQLGEENKVQKKAWQASCAWEWVGQSIRICLIRRVNIAVIIKFPKFYRTLLLFFVPAWSNSYSFFQLGVRIVRSLLIVLSFITWLRHSEDQ